MTSRTGWARMVLGIWRKLLELRTGHRTRRVDFRLLSEALGRCRTRLGRGRWKSQNRRIVLLSPYVEKPLNWKVIKSFVPELKSRKCFSCFEIPMFYVIYICEHCMSISHIAVSGYGIHRRSEHTESFTQKWCLNWMMIRKNSASECVRTSSSIIKMKQVSSNSVVTDDETFTFVQTRKSSSRVPCESFQRHWDWNKQEKVILITFIEVGDSSTVSSCHSATCSSSKSTKRSCNICFAHCARKKNKNVVGCPRGVMVKAMDCGIVVREFVLQSRYYVPFRANTLGKGMNPFILPAMG